MEKYNYLTLIGEPYKKGKYKYGIWKCDCGNEKEIRIDSVKSGNTQSCGCLKKNTRGIRDLTGQKFGKLTAIRLAEKGIDINTTQTCAIWICQCDCGNSAIVRGTALTSGHTESCGCQNSKGNAKIAKILSELNVPFIQEFSFNDFRNVNPYRFDFAILDRNNPKIPILLIEYQGTIHYGTEGLTTEKSWLNENHVKEVQRVDTLKVEYCKNHNIPLLVIPYWKSGELKSIIENEINKVLGKD